MEEVVAVQRLALLQAAGEDQPTGSCEDELPLDKTQRADQVKASFVSLVALRDVNLFGGSSMETESEILMINFDIMYTFML